MITVITNRKLCDGDFLERIRLIAKCKPSRIILREKDLSEQDYEALAQSCKAVCEKYGVEFSIHLFADVARRLHIKNIHIPLFVLKQNPGLTQEFKTVGVSVHSAEEAVFAQECGVSYIIAGHIFETDCKKGLPPRGTDFLSEICRSVSLPVFAIGGITPEKMKELYACGAAGGCVMSGMMCGDTYKDFFLSQKSQI